MKNTTANKGKITSSSGFPLWTKRNNKLVANNGITTQIQKAEMKSLILSLAIVKTSCLVLSVNSHCTIQGGKLIDKYYMYEIKDSITLYIEIISLVSSTIGKFSSLFNGITPYVNIIQLLSKSDLLSLSLV